MNIPVEKWSPQQLEDALIGLIEKGVLVAIRDETEAGGFGLRPAPLVTDDDAVLTIEELRQYYRAWVEQLTEGNKS